MQAGHEALADGLGGQRVAREKTRQAGSPMGTAWVVLHGARTQRVELGIYGEVFTRQIGVVTHGLHFRNFRQRGQIIAPELDRNVCQRAIGVLQLLAPGDASCHAKLEDGARFFATGSHADSTACMAPA